MIDILHFSLSFALLSFFLLSNINCIYSIRHSSATVEFSATYFLFECCIETLRHWKLSNDIHLDVFLSTIEVELWVYYVRLKALIPI